MNLAVSRVQLLLCLFQQAGDFDQVPGFIQSISALLGRKRQLSFITHPLTVNPKHWPPLQLLLQQWFHTIPLCWLRNDHNFCFQELFHPRNGRIAEGKQLLFFHWCQFLISWLSCRSFLFTNAVGPFFPTPNDPPQNQPPCCNTQQGGSCDRHCCLSGHFSSPSASPTQNSITGFLSQPAKEKGGGMVVKHSLVTRFTKHKTTS